MEKKILITGRNGFIGRNLFDYLNNKKYIVSPAKRDTNKKDLFSIIKNSDVVIHTAAITNPFDKEIWKVNLDYTNLIVRVCKKLDKKLIYISTQNVLFGTDTYSKTKRLSEKLVKTLKSYVILRPTIVYGKNEDRYISNLINLIKKSPLIPIIGDGKNKIQPLYLNDLIKIIEFCINKNVNGVYLIAGKSIITYNDLINQIINILKVNRLKVHIPIVLLKPIAYILQNISKKPFITTVQLENIKKDLVFDTDQIQKFFKINLTNLEEGLNNLLKNGKK